MDSASGSGNGEAKQDVAVTWDDITQKNFERMIGKIPIFLRSIAEKKVFQRAEGIAREEGRGVVCEKDMVDAFFIETPFGFHGPMKTDMEDLGIDYVQYGYPK